jgi:phosphoribosyl 1,2-cyclic phosphodiesterase
VQFALLGSGSRGNGTLVRHGDTYLLIDCGFSLRETEQRLARLDTTAQALSAILVTHEHTDHMRGVDALARKYALPVWATRGTLASGRLSEEVERREICSHRAFALGDLLVQPFPVPHDAREPSQFVFSDGASHLGLLTDTGCSTPHIEQQLSGCDALILECNHERELLEQGEYPWPLKQRVGGDRGHLSNAQAAAILGRLDNRRLRQVVAAHLSEKHNTPALARAALALALGCEDDWVQVADQDQGLGWREV